MGYACVLVTLALLMLLSLSVVDAARGYGEACPHSQTQRGMCCLACRSNVHMQTSHSVRIVCIYAWGHAPHRSATLLIPTPDPVQTTYGLNLLCELLRRNLAHRHCIFGATGSRGHKGDKGYKGADGELLIFVVQGTNLGELQHSWEPWDRKNVSVSFQYCCLSMLLAQKTEVLAFAAVP
jgi:hypothetical protein